MEKSALLVATLLLAGSAPAQDARLCGEDEERAWKIVWERSLGVDAVDPERFSIQTARADELRWPAATDGLHQWVPFGPRKAKLCGALREHRPYCPNELFDVFSECDRNAFLLPARDYEYLREEPIENKLVTDPDKMVCCETARECSGDDKVRCIETEVTPSAEITKNEALYRHFQSLLGPETTRHFDAPGTKPWLWKEMCTYGPWVGDAGHGARPEIHPVQLRWTREADEQSLVLMLMQDASARFIEPRSFVHRRRPPDEWNPWAASPVRGLFRVAFRSDPSSAATIRISREMGNHVHRSDPDGCRRTGEGCVLDAQADGRTVLRVVKLLPPRDVAVRVDPVCRRPDGSFLGYVEIEAAVGHEGCDEEGYLVLRVEELPGSVENPALAYRGNPLFEEGEGAGAAEETAPSGLRLRGGVTRVEPGDLQMVEGAEAEIAWRALVDSMAPTARLGEVDAPPVGIVRARKWKIAMEPHYEGTPESARRPELEVDVNEAIAERKTGEIERIVPSAGDFHVSLPGSSVEVEDVSQPGRSVSVASEAAHEREAPARADSIRIEPWKTSNWSPGVRIRIPDEPPGAVYRVRLRARLEDRSENHVELGYSFLSHGLDGRRHREAVEALLDRYPETSRLAASDLLELATTLDDPWDDNRSLSARASQLLVIAESSGADGIITAGELEGLLEQLLKFRDAFNASPPPAR